MQEDELKTETFVTCYVGCHIQQYQLNITIQYTDRSSGVPMGVVWGVQTPRNAEVLTKLSRIPSSVENTSVTV
jgi:hypothetical protein